MGSSRVLLYSRVIWASWDPTMSLVGQTGILECIGGCILDSTGVSWEDKM